MSVRAAKQTLTGVPSWRIGVILGYRTDGSPGITVSAAYRGAIAITDPDVIAALIEDLGAALAHLRQPTKEEPDAQV